MRNHAIDLNLADQQANDYELLSDDLNDSDVNNEDFFSLQFSIFF